MSNIEVTNRRIHQAFRALTKALETTPLPSGQPGDFIKGKPEEFMLMGIERLPTGGKRSAFKHAETRNYLWLEKGQIRLGDGVSPFQRHEFRSLA